MRNAFSQSTFISRYKTSWRDGLRERKYTPGASLPNELMLAQDMGVSVGTIRKAVEMLCAERLLVRSQGRGTHVIDRRSADYRSKFDRIRNADGTAILWHLRELQREVRAATEVERQRLQLSGDASVIIFRRLREIAGKPVKTEYSRLPHEIYGDIEDLEVQDTTIENISVRRGVTLSLIDERVTIAAADEDVSAELQVPAQTSLLRLERIVFSSARRPIEWRICYCHLGDKQYQAPSPIGAKA